MADRKTRFVEIDKLQEQLGAEGNVVERIAAFYNVQLPELHTTPREVRMACEFACGKEAPTGDRAISVRVDTAVPLLNCFHYGCTVRGNILKLMYMMKHNTAPPDRLAGAAFREIRDDLQTLMSGGSDAAPVITPETKPEPPKDSASPTFNIPLEESEREKVRELTNLDECFIVVGDENMNRHAAAYQRQHAFLTPEVCKLHRCGYLPGPGNSGDHRGGTLQKDWVYCYQNEQGQSIVWFGRNVQYEKQHSEWASGGRKGKEPTKFHFVRGFQRGIEVLGQHDWNVEAVQQRIRDEIGALLLVEGPNDRIALGTIGVDAFAICSNIITREQAEKTSAKAREIGVPVGVMFDNDVEGDSGARTSIPLLAEFGPVQSVWSRSMFAEQFKNRQPESLSQEEWQVIHNSL